MLNSPVHSAIRSPQWDALEKAAELLQAKATIKKLESQISRGEADKRLCVELEKNLELCKNQCEAEKQKVEELHKQLKFLTNREEELSETIVNLKDNAEAQKHMYEKKILAVQSQCQKLEIELDEVKNEKNSIAERLGADITKLNAELQLSYSELEQSKEQITLLTRQVQDLNQHAQLAQNFHSQLLITQQKLKDLEDEMNSQKEASVLARTMYSELNKLPELEKENAQLKQENQILRESGNRTLLLQEQLVTAQERYKLLEKNYQELLELQSEHEITKIQLKAWETLGNKSSTGSPGEISRQISQMQKNELRLTEKVGELTSSLHSVEAQKQKLEAQNKSCRLELEKMNHKNEEQIASIRRLQKRLLLVIKERDSYKRVIDSYENEVTLNVPAMQMERIRSLEETIEGYRNLVQKLEAEVQDTQTKLRESNNQDTLTPASKVARRESCPEAVAQLKDQVNRQQEHIQQLEKENKLLQKQLEETNLQNSQQGKEYKIVHFTANPFDQAVQQRVQEMQQLKEENQVLKTRIQVLEESKSRPEDLTAQVQLQMEKAATLPSVESLQEQLNTAEKKNKRLMEAFKKTSQEFREACYMLTGYKIDIQPRQKYKLSHMYAESADDFLLFEQTPENNLHLLETEYSRRLGDLISTYLHGHDSIPAFLSSITLDLFRHQTLFVMDAS